MKPKNLISIVSVLIVCVIKTYSAYNDDKLTFTDEYSKPTNNKNVKLNRRPTRTTTKISTTTTIPTTTTTTKPSTTTTTTTRSRLSSTIISYCSGGIKADPNGGKSICLSDAYNKTRLANELDCTFPFSYKNVWYDTCANIDKGYYWCSIDRVYTNRFASCETYCPLLARRLVRGINDTHDSCLQIPSNTGIISRLPTDQAQINFILDYHNQIRSNASKPFSDPTVTTVYPSATDMRAVYWDLNLARTAQKWVEYLALKRLFQHDCNECRLLVNNQSIFVGQNLFAVEGLEYDPTVIWQWSIGAWYGEKKNFLYGSATGSITGDFASIGHYTQLITAGVARIGCGVAQFNDIIYTGCNYADGQTYPPAPYTNGTSCAKCSAQNCKNNICFCNKYCQNCGILDPIACTCTCRPFATGAECEFLTCDKTDVQYQCYNPTDPTFCRYSNIKFNCPHMCGYCDYL